MLIYAHMVNALTLDEKIGQLFVISINTDLPPEVLENGKKVIEKYHIGGILLQQSTPEAQIALIKELQSHRALPLLTLQDSEWGLSMRLRNALRFPKNMALGAIRDESLLVQFGKEIGRELKLTGISIGLMPVVDVNSNPLNPIIGMRSFGDDPQAVARKASLVMKGLQEEGIIACAKHFPGHGDVTQDSHETLPLIEHLELLPFQVLIDQGVKAIMVAHLLYPPLSNEPTSLSYQVVTELLQKKMGFHGLVISDAMNMKAITDLPGEAAIKAILAGNDLLIYGHHKADTVKEIQEIFIPQAFEAVREAVISGRIPETLIEAKVSKILQAKQNMAPILEGELFPPSAYALKRQLFRQSLTLLADKPLSTHFRRVIEVYSKNDISSEPADLIVLYATPYLIPHLPKNVPILVAYEDDPDTHEAVRDFLNGTFIPTGSLPIHLN